MQHRGYLGISLEDSDEYSEGVRIVNFFPPTLRHFAYGWASEVLNIDLDL